VAGSPEHIITFWHLYGMKGRDFSHGFSIRIRFLVIFPGREAPLSRVALLFFPLHKQSLFLFSIAGPMAS
jgi:hypothetical protein